MRALALLALLVSGPAQAAEQHWRLDAGARGPVHVYAPPGYQPRTAAVVIYVHGLLSDADDTWRKHKLARQFRASGQNALFIVPEAPVKGEDEVVWPRLGELLRFVGKEVELPRGPLVAVGHSAAFRTISEWLDYGPLDTIILVDALYGSEEDFHLWMTAVPGHGAHRLLVVASDTLRFSDPLIERHPEVRRLERLPAELPAALRRARLVYLRTTIGHMALITQGAVLPVVLGFIPARR